jgi:hypothetical protein
MTIFIMGLAANTKIYLHASELPHQTDPGRT